MERIGWCLLSQLARSARRPAPHLAFLMRTMSNNGIPRKMARRLSGETRKHRCNLEILTCCITDAGTRDDPLRMACRNACDHVAQRSERVDSPGNPKLPHWATPWVALPEMQPAKKRNSNVKRSRSRNIIESALRKRRVTH